MATAKQLAKIYRALGNERRVEIMILLSKGPKTLTEISRKLSYPLSRTSAYVTELETFGLVKKTRKETNVFVEALVFLKTNGWIKFK